MPINDRAKCNHAISADHLIEIAGKVQEHSWFLVFSPLSHHDAAADGSPALRFARDGCRAGGILRPRSFRRAISLNAERERKTQARSRAARGTRPHLCRRAADQIEKKPTPSPLFARFGRSRFFGLAGEAKRKWPGLKVCTSESTQPWLSNFILSRRVAALFLNNPEAPGDRAGCYPEPICRKRESRKLWSPGCAGKGPSASSA